MPSGSEAPRGPHPAGPALARRRAQPQPARGAPYPKILARRAGGPQRRGAPGVRAPEGRRPHAALATTYRSWEGSWGPWVSLPGCAWRWPSSSEPAQLRSVAWPPSCHLSSPGPGDARGRRLMQGGSAITFHGSEPRRTPLLPARAACRAPQTSPGCRHLRGACSYPAHHHSACRNCHGHWWAGRAAAPRRSPHAQVKRCAQLLRLSSAFPPFFPSFC